MQRWLMTILLSGVCTGFGQNKRPAIAATGQSSRKELRDIIGVTHVDGKYCLTNEDFLNEGADQILALGSRVIKVWFHNPQKKYTFNSNWPQMNSLVEIAKSPYFRELFDKPMTTYILMCFSMGRDAAYWRKCITEKQ